MEKLESNNLGSKENLSEESKSSSTNSLDKIGSACTTPTSLSSPSSVTSAVDGGVSVDLRIVYRISNSPLNVLEVNMLQLLT